MKRLLEMISLVFCALLMSCSNGISDKTGDINFSLNVEDALRAASLDRATDGSDNTANSEKEYIFLVQVKGSRNYYDYQIQTVRVENNTSANAGQSNPQQTGNIFTVSDPYGDYIRDNELSFTFGYVPANQKYKVMFDMFEKAPRGDSSNGSSQPLETIHVLSGHSSDIQVLRGMQSPVEVDIDSFEYSPISIVVEDEDGNIHYSNSPRAKAYSYSNNDNVTSYVYKKYGKLWYEEQDNENDEEDAYYPIKNIYYSLDPESNYPDSSFKFSVPGSYGYYETPTEGFSFQGTNGSLYDFLSKYSFPTGVGELTLGSPATISKDNLSFTENMPEIIFDSNDEVESGQITKTILFEKKSYSDYDYETNQSINNYVLLYSDDLSELLHLSPELETASIALVLTAKDDSPVTNNVNLFFKYKETTSFNPASFNGDELYNAINCQTHKPGDRRYVIPLNDVTDTEQPLIMFIQCDDDASDCCITFDIDYYIFPGDAFIFGIEVEKDADENYLYRHEMDEYFTPSGPYASEGNTFTAKITGVICNFNLADKSYSLARTGLNADFYDNSNGFESATYGDSDDIRFIQTDGTCTYNGENNSYQFKFADTKDWNSITSNIKFLCHTLCNDTNTLLVIRDYYLYTYNETSH